MLKHLPKSMQITLALTTTVSLILAFYWWYYNSHYITTENAYVQTELSPVSARMMGYVRDVFVNENDHVKKGQILLKLDDVDSKLELTFKQAKLKKAKSDMERAKVLQKERAVSDSDIEMAEATFAGINTEVEGGLLKIKFTEVISPIDGIVAKRSAEPGQFVQPGQSLFVVVPEDKIWIKANFKENQIRYMRTGQDVSIHVDAYPGETWEGKVEFIYPSSVASLSLAPPENSTGNFTKVAQRFPVKISFKQRAEHPLYPGMSVEPTVYVH